MDKLTLGRAQYEAAEHPALHPGQSARVMLDHQAIGWIGKLHPKWQQHYQLARGVILFELDLAALQKRDVPAYAEVSKFPPIRRDMAIVVDEETSLADLLKAMQGASIQFVTEIALFDLYRGKGIPEAKKSLAFLVMMQDSQKSLTDTEADKVMADLLGIVKKEFGAELR